MCKLSKTHMDWIPNWDTFCNPIFQVDLRHIDEENGRSEVEIGVDLTEFYMSVEWDILEVPAIRNVKYYTCCDEPYLVIFFIIYSLPSLKLMNKKIIWPLKGFKHTKIDVVFSWYLISGRGLSTKSRFLGKPNLVWEIILWHHFWLF